MKTAAFATATANPDLPGVRDVDASELAPLTQKVHVIDVRRPAEWSSAIGHIAGAKLIVLDTLEDHIDALPKNETIVFVCHSGGRSGLATSLALANGFTDVYNMKGGMLRWNQLGLPIET